MFMPIVYETTAKIAEGGRLSIHIENLPFDEGTEFLVKLVPKKSFNEESFKRKMRSLLNKFSQDNPYQNMTKDQIIADLRRQREAMYGEFDQN